MLSTSVVVTQIRSTLCSELVSCTITTLALTFVAGASVSESQAFDDGVDAIFGFFQNPKLIEY